MPFPLHKAPKGLLELFRLRTLGAQPLEFAEAVAPVVEISDFYTQDQRVVTSTAAGVGALLPELFAQQQFVNAPLTSGRLLAIGARFQVGAAAATNVAGGIVLTSGSTSVALGSWFYAGLAAGQVVRWGVIVPRWVLPLQGPTGTYFVSATVSGTAAGADHSIGVTNLQDALGAN